MGFVASEIGESALSTSIRIVSDCTNCPDEVTPIVPSMYGPGEMLTGIVEETVAGTDVALPTNPTGSSPITHTLVIARPAGEVTVTDRV